MQPFNTSSMYPFSSQNLCYILIIRIWHTMKPMFFTPPSIVLKLDWSETGIGPSLKKNRRSYNPVWSGQLTQQNPIKNLAITRWLFFLFFIKTTSFWFLKNRVDSVKTCDLGLGLGRSLGRVSKLCS